MSNFPTQVSKTLRDRGIRVLYAGNPITWEGIRVSRSAAGDGATVMVDIDNPDRAAALADRVEATLTAAGYDTSRTGTTIHVQK